MPKNAYFVVFFAILWSALELTLLVRDKKNNKGSTTRDRKSRLFNFLATECSLLSALVMLFPVCGIYSRGPGLLAAGTIAALSGILLRHSAIRYLGKYFRTTVEIGKDQPVIQKGPYRYVRHPSYSGIILFFIGYGILSQNWICLAVCAILPFSALLYRIQIEEEALVRELGEAYKDYMKKTKRLIPFVW